MINNVVTALCKNMKCACVKCVKTLKLEPYIVTTLYFSVVKFLHTPIDLVCTAKNATRLRIDKTYII